MAAEDHKKVLWMGAALMALAMLMAVADPAHAGSRIRAGSCDVWTTQPVDPIAKTTHLHSFVGGISQPLTNDVTGAQVMGYNQTTCNAADNWATSLRWFPRAKSFIATKDTLYYRDPGDIGRLQDIPTDLRLLSAEVILRGSDTTLRFPNCLQMNSSMTAPMLDSPTHTSHAYFANSKPCPSTHPYRIPMIAYLIHWPSKLSASTPISMGTNEWGPAGTGFHGDYLAASQPELNDRLIDVCLNNVPTSTTVADPACGLGP